LSLFIHVLLRCAASLIIAFGFWLGSTADADAAGFQFSPVRINLTARNPVASILLTNPGDAPLRLEVKAFRWSQRVDGQPALDETDTLLVFPQLLTIPPHEQRAVRVATTEPAGAREGTYKVSVTEIGSFSTPQTRSAGVSIRMQANLPVFIAPTIERRAGAIADASVQKKSLTFVVVNDGTVHFITSGVRVTGIGADSRPLFSQELDNDDVFAGGRREYHVDLARKQCGALRALSIQLEAGDQHLIQTFELPSGACAT
jgi:fimbrial chaperone protein